MSLQTPDQDREEMRRRRMHRLRRRGKRAYIRSVYFLPSLCTLGNAICGFAAIYVASLNPEVQSLDPLTNFFSQNHFALAAYLIFASMVFDALDGRLARLTRHTTDFGGQLDSLSDAIAFGAAPAFIALQVVKSAHPELHPILSRLIWATAALYMSCAVLRLARFNVSNEHGEQHHYSFLGLPSPGAAGAIVSIILLQQELAQGHLARFAGAAALALPFVLALTGIMMISTIRYSHLVNRYMRGKRSMARLIIVLSIVLLFVVIPKYTLTVGLILYAFSGPATWAMGKLRPKSAEAPPAKPPGT